METGRSGEIDASQFAYEGGGYGFRDLPTPAVACVLADGTLEGRGEGEAAEVVDHVAETAPKDGVQGEGTRVVGGG